MSKLTAEQRIERTHVQLMKHKNFCLFSGLFMVGKISVDDKCPTAKTNGVDVTYGRAFVTSLTDKALAFLILHENMHKAYRHLVVWQALRKQNAQLANAACDYVINLQIRDYDPQGHDVEMPVDADGEVMGLIDEKYRGMDAAQVFKLLLDKQGNAGGGSVGGSRSESGEGKGMDEHDWDGAIEASPEEQKEVTDEIERALRQGGILAGKMGGEMSKEIADLLTPKIDWREALRDFVKTTTQGKDQTTWRRLHKRYIGCDIIMPSSYDEKVGSILVGIDTSGSIGMTELAGFLSEVKSICDEVSPEKIDLLYWDTRVASHEVYMGNELASLTESTKPIGGGGTNPDCVPKFMKKEAIRPECVIMLTDGYIDSKKETWHDLTAPVMWCIKGNSRFSPDTVVGKVVHVE
jgi:predicted metal-dependent peptidase